MTPTELTRAAEYRYHTDALFHARVHRAVEAIELDVLGNTGCRLDKHDRSLSTLAAAVGLFMSELDPVAMT